MTAPRPEYVLAGLGFVFTMPFATTGYVPHFTLADPFIAGVAIATVGCRLFRQAPARMIFGDLVPWWAVVLFACVGVTVIWSANPAATVAVSLRILGLAIVCDWIMRNWRPDAFGVGLMWGLGFLAFTAWRAGPDGGYWHARISGLTRYATILGLAGMPAFSHVARNRVLHWAGVLIAGALVGLGNTRAVIVGITGLVALDRRLWREYLLVCAMFVALTFWQGIEYRLGFGRPPGVSFEEHEQKRSNPLAGAVDQTKRDTEKRAGTVTGEGDGGRVSKELDSVDPADIDDSDKAAGVRVVEGDDPGDRRVVIEKSGAAQYDRYLGGGAGAFHAANPTAVRPHSAYAFLWAELGVLVVIPFALLALLAAKVPASRPAIAGLLLLGVFDDSPVSQIEGFYVTAAVLAMRVAVGKRRQWPEPANRKREELALETS